MKQKGLKFVPGTVSEWMDCGNKDITVETNGRVLQFAKQDGQNLVSKTVTLDNSNIIDPCYIGENVVLKNTTIGPNVSLGDDCVVENSKIEDSLIQTNTTIKNADLKNAMIGNHAYFDGNFKSVSIGDYSVLD
jgi:glucose-1-phosphate thymidylyltransferase